MTDTLTLDGLGDAIFVRKLSSGDNLGAGKDHHGAVGLLPSNTNYLARYGIKFAEPDWAAVRQIVSAAGKVKARTAHSSLGSNPRFYVRFLTGSWAQGTWGGQGGGDPSQETWSASNATVYPGPPGQSGANLIDSGNLGPVAAGEIVTFDLTAYYEKIAPPTVLKSDGVTPCEGLANNGVILVSYDTGSGTRYLEFDSTDGAWAPRVALVVVLDQEPTTPEFTTLGGASASSGMTVSASAPVAVITAQDPDDTDCAMFDWSLIDLTASTAIGSGSSVASGISGMVITLTLPTLTDGHQYQLNVATMDPAGLWSNWGHLVFTKTQAPSATFSDPASAGIVAHVAMASGWNTPRLVVGWAYSDPASKAQNAYRVKVYTDSGGAPVGFPGTPAHDTGVVASGSQGPVTLAYDLSNGAYYHLTIEVRNSDGVWSAQSAARRVRARWAKGAYHIDTNPTAVTAWSFAYSTSGTGPDAQVFVEVGSNSSASAPAAYKASLAEVAIARHFHYRVWLLAWGSATPTSPKVTDATLTYNSGALTSDGWLLGTGASIDTSDYVYGTQCLRIDGVAANGGRTARQGKASDGHLPITLLPRTEYVLQCRQKNIGAANGRLFVRDQSGNALFNTPVVSDDTSDSAAFPDNANGWVRSVSAVYSTGEQAVQVYVEAWMDGGAGTAALVDAVKLEASRVATPWSPGFVGRGVSIDAGGVQVDKTSGSVFRLFASAGDAVRDVLELQAHGIRFGSDGVEVMSPAAGILHVGTLRVAEVAAPATPPSGFGYLYEDTSGALHFINDAGVDTTLGGSGSGGSGTSFPGSPTTGDRYWRTDRNIEYFYDGTRWLSTQLFFIDIIAVTAGAGGAGAGLQPFTATSTNVMRGRLASRGSLYHIWVEQVDYSFYVAAGGSALGASHNWVVALDADVAAANLSTLTVDSGASATWRSYTQTIGAELWDDEYAWNMDVTKTGTPGNLFVMPVIQYRLVG